MGYFGQWLVAKGVDAPTLREWGLEPWGEGAARGWLFARTQDPSRLADHVAKASAEGGAAVGAAVFDSDFAYVVAARDGVQAAEVAVNLESAQSYDVDLPSYPDAFARWTQVAPRALTGDEVRDILSKNWVLAEEGVQELFERAGLPQPYDPGKPADLPTRDRPSPATVESVNAGGLGGYQSTFGWMRDAYRVAGEDLPWADARYVPGVGADFLGIWDREDPSMPAFRFPRTSRGESQLEAELERLRRTHELLQT